jgi:hypothetical protein
MEIEMNNEFPAEGQIVRAKIGNGMWQPATYRCGQFVDLYGLPLDQRKISAWEPVTAQFRTTFDEGSPLRE